MFPKRLSNELILLFKGKDLKQDLKTLKEVVGNSSEVTMIISSKSSIEMEYEDAMTMV